MSVKELIYFNKKKIILLIGAIVVGSSCLLGYLYFMGDDAEDNTLDSGTSLILEKDVEEIKEVLCYFDIKGEVNNPGVYSIDCNKRIIDAIDVSGGLTNNSDTSVLNLSKKIEDGMVILVYSKKEVTTYLETLEKNEKKQSICDSSNIVNGACNTSSSTINSSLININTANLNELMTLTGIGEAKAKNIIAYREQTPFKSIEEILNVDGIGENIYVNIKENITV